MTVSKLFNMILSGWNFHFRKTVLRSSPLYLKVEPTRICNLRCTGCVQSIPEYKSQSGIKENFDLNNFKNLIDQLHKKLLGISFSYYGEPLLGKYLTQMISYAHHKGVGTMFPTNLSLKISDQKADEIVGSGLDMMMISLDGASNKTYSKYRIGGNFNLVMQNLEKLVQAKAKNDSKTPHLRWKFIVFEHNKHEVEYAKANYRRLGFDSLSLEHDMYDKKNPLKQKKLRYLKNLKNKKVACFWMWFTMIIEYNGNVAPCCGIDDLVTVNPFKLGNVHQKPAMQVWNGLEYQMLRKGFQKNGDVEMNSVCQACTGNKALEVEQQLMYNFSATDPSNIKQVAYESL